MKLVVDDRSCLLLDRVYNRSKGNVRPSALSHHPEVRDRAGQLFPSHINLELVLPESSKTKQVSVDDLFKIRSELSPYNAEDPKPFSHRSQEGIIPSSWISVLVPDRDYFVSPEANLSHTDRDRYWGIENTMSIIWQWISWGMDTCILRLIGPDTRVCYGSSDSSHILPHRVPCTARSVQARRGRRQV